MQLRNYSSSGLQDVFSYDVCRELSMFGALTQECLEFLLSEGHIYECEQGDVLFSPGEGSGNFYIVLSGRVGFSRQKSDKSIYIRSFNPGEQIGFVGMIGLHERRGYAVIEKPGYLLEVSSELFHQICEKYPADFVIFLINITREMGREINHLDSLCADIHTIK
ncbi:Crp/Fnr family transcriptional regulator [Neptunomonas antarctica]|uniref:Cyclic nucleotide-binding domain-containing protein n=1 Tax=Neptunomonas antarctica TaxID=619304 RepID=A0A1N7JAY3_9GAMM|nr:cyclic nucleotide-binding domain-containing protein [Neptunomonas antarctica]SIS46454.1 Cyclic nucleotide-binding domain-containing protein [Neptunomonas antarctica]